MVGKKLVLIVAGGSGKRMNSITPKQYIRIGEKPILLMTIEAFLKSSEVNFLRVVISKSHIEMYKKIVSRVKDKRLLPFALGGTSRTESVYNGLKSFKNMALNKTDKILIHDAARPFITQDLIARLFSELETAEAVFPKIPISDALWYKSENSFNKGPARELLFRAQTPQGFYFEQIKKLYENNNETHLDDISIAQSHKLKISGILGDPINIKLTTPEDLTFAEKVSKIWM